MNTNSKKEALVTDYMDGIHDALKHSLGIAELIRSVAENGVISGELELSPIALAGSINAVVNELEAAQEHFNDLCDAYRNISPRPSLVGLTPKTAGEA